MSRVRRDAIVFLFSGITLFFCGVIQSMIVEQWYPLCQSLAGLASILHAHRSLKHPNKKPDKFP